VQEIIGWHDVDLDLTAGGYKHPKYWGGITREAEATRQDLNDCKYPTSIAEARQY